jgi:hypothetical protein
MTSVGFTGHRGHPLPLIRRTLLCRSPPSVSESAAAWRELMYVPVNKTRGFEVSYVRSR